MTQGLNVYLFTMRRDALVVGINQYPFLKDTPTSKAKHLTTPAADAERSRSCWKLMITLK
ncbi:MAG: hypothetical protein HC907_38740 [Richelia sp. SM1_7_0]|nr:hypothetical protein [Richelia sp. SM1_7_0]